MLKLTYRHVIMILLLLFIVMFMVHKDNIRDCNKFYSDIICNDSLLLDYKNMCIKREKYINFDNINIDLRGLNKNETS